MIRIPLFVLALGSSLFLIGCGDDGGSSLSEPTTQSSINTVDTSNPHANMPTEANMDTSVSSYNESSANVDPNAPTTSYTVQKGDSLWKIAKENNTSAGIIKALNNLTGNTIQVGQVLKLPAQ